MLPPTTEPTPRRLRLLTGALLTAAVLVAAGPLARADDEVKTASALTKVPADAAFFSTSLRLKEQVDLFYNSNAYKTLRSLPLVKQAYEKAMKDLAREGGPLEQYRQFTANKQNQELVDLLVEAASEEVFIYGGKTWNDFIQLAGRINNAQSWAPLQAAVSGGNPQNAQARAILLAMQKNLGLVQVPELILGFKVKDRKKAQDQIQRLEKLAANHAENLPPQLKGKVKVARTKIGDTSFLTVQADGTIIPWEDVNFSNFEEKKDEFEPIIQKLKKTTLALSIGLKDGYLLLGIASTPQAMTAIGGTGKSLATRPEMQPLTKHAGKRLTGVSYTSREFNVRAASSQMDLDSIAGTLKEILGKTEAIREERKKAIEKDLDRLVAEGKKSLPQYGAAMAFSYLTPTGYEGYSYNFGNHDRLKGVTTKLPQHFGGDPIFAAAIGFKATGNSYRTLVKWAQATYGHAEAIFKDTAPAEAQDAYDRVAKAMAPVWKRFDEITTKQFLPSLGDSGVGLVIDARWSSKQWHQTLPTLEKPLPMLEIGLLLGISDARGFEKAMADYRKTFNELYEKIREASPDKDNVPEFKLPAPETEKGKAGTLIYYPFPAEAGFDTQVQPVAGIGKDVSVLTFSKAHANRLLASRPVKVKGLPPLRRTDALGMCVLNWPALVDAAAPWIEFSIGMTTVVPADGDDDGKAAKKQVEAVMKQVKVALDVLRCFRGATNVTYLEDGKLVSHTQIIVKDLEKSPAE